MFKRPSLFDQGTNVMLPLPPAPTEPLTCPCTCGACPAQEGNRLCGGQHRHGHHRGLHAHVAACANTVVRVSNPHSAALATGRVTACCLLRKHKVGQPVVFCCNPPVARCPGIDAELVTNADALLSIHPRNRLPGIACFGLRRPQHSKSMITATASVPLCRPKVKASRSLLAMFAGCPDNAFQRVQPGMEPFSLGQRLGAILRNGLKLWGVGFCASLLGETGARWEGRGVAGEGAGPWR